MSKTLALMILFNVLMGIAFILSNIYIWDFINNLTSKAGHDSNGTTIPIINVNALQVTGGTVGWTGEGILIPGIPPATVPNYPFLLFFVTTIGNMLFAIYILRSKNHCAFEIRPAN